MNDVISRKALMEFANNSKVGITANDIARFPSAQKKGRWVKAEGVMPPEYHGGYLCSECEGWAPRDWRHYKLMLSSHCPHCGADMRGDED